MLRRKSLAFKLVLGGILAVLIPVGVVGLFSVDPSSRALSNLSENQAILVSKALADMTELVLREELKLAKSLAEDNDALAATGKVRAEGIASTGLEIEHLVRKMRRSMDRTGADYEAIFVTDADGRIAHARSLFSSNQDLCPRHCERQRLIPSSISVSSEMRRIPAPLLCRNRCFHCSRWRG